MTSAGTPAPAPTGSATASGTSAPNGKEPAKLSYFYGPGFADMVRLAHTVLDNIREDMAITATTTRRWIRNQCDAEGWLRTILAWLIVAAEFLYWMSTAVAQLFAGATFCLFMLLPQMVIFCVIEAVMLLFGAIVAGLDSIVTHVRHISYVCESCHARFTLPVYACADCGAKHCALKPNRYGTLRHACTCGKKLPSTILRPSRAKLDAMCPNCWASGIETPLTNAVNRTIVIPVVGGESSGKTALITAFTTDLIGTRSAAHGLTATPDGADKQTMYATMSSDYASGTVAKTATQQNAADASAFSMSLFLAGPKLNPERRIQLVDIAGETFVNNAENEQQLQYRDADALVLVIDPMSLPVARSRFGASLDAGDSGTISSARAEDVLTALNNNLRAAAQLDRHGRLDMPIAIVLSKMDESQHLLDRFGDPAVIAMKGLDAQRYGDWFDDMDFLCRQYLYDMDMGDIVDSIAQTFPNNRFFAVSAIGHTAGDGKGFTPKYVDDVIDWILRHRDPTLADALGARRFSNAKLPIVEPAVGLYDTMFAQTSVASETNTAI